MAVQPINVPQQLAYVLNRAGDKSGVDFDYLLQTAMRESSLNPQAKAQTSSAVGLFQFLEGTWLEVMKTEGPKLGYEKYANAIVDTGDGYTVPDRQMREEILSLREDPQIAADMAAAFTRRNGEYLSDKFGRMPSAGELYIAHFLGAEGAARLFEAGLETPDRIAAKLFPAQADANKAIFYANGEPRTIREVYEALVSKHAPRPGGSPEFAAQQMAQNPDQQTAPVAAQEAPRMSFRSLYSNSGNESQGAPLVDTSGAGAGFFTQLYNK